jgi:hypothetical protein
VHFEFAVSAGWSVADAEQLIGNLKAQREALLARTRFVLRMPLPHWPIAMPAIPPKADIPKRD